MPRERVIQGANPEPDDDGTPNGTAGQASSGTPPKTAGRDSGGTPPIPPSTGGRPFDRDDDRNDDALRPQRLDQVIGQRKVVERVRVMLEANRKRGDTLGHILFDGPPGIGKTTLATVIPRELGVECQIAAGPALSAPKDLLPYLTNASRTRCCSLMRFTGCRRQSRSSVPGDGGFRVNSTGEG